jgi:hypothetical protein
LGVVHRRNERGDQPTQRRRKVTGPASRARHEFLLYGKHMTLRDA